MYLRSLMLLIITVVCSDSATDYCSVSLCGPDRKHIACKHNGKFNADCPRFAEIVNLTKPMQEFIVKQHNTKRSFVASGYLRHLKSACRMATIAWDSELASLAAYNVKQCEVKLDDCHNTKAFKHSGQNLGYLRSANTSNTIILLNKMIDKWYSENEDCEMRHIDSYPESYRGPPIGHFTLMVNELNTRVGCAVALYYQPGDSKETFLMACNYAITNIISKPTFASCSTVATGCKRGRNPRYPGLCFPTEPITLPV